MGYAICCSDDGNTLVCLSRRVNLFDLSSRKRIWSVLPFSHASEADFSPDGKILAVKNTSGRILALDSASGNVIHDYKNQKEGEGSEVFFSPEGNRLIDASWKGVITVRKLLEPTIVTEQSFPGEMIVRVSHDTTRRTWLFEHHPVVRPGENWPSPPYLTIEKWPIGEGTAKVIALDLDISASATISPDASRICYVCIRRGLGRWIKVAQAIDGETLASSEEIKTGGPVRALAWSPDGRYIGTVQKRRFVFYKASDLSFVGEVPCTYPSSICFLPGKNDVVLGSWKASVLVGLDAIAAGKVKMS
ncbi:WD40 repeat domain-containing protein [Acidicapsa dinghuensis]|uniref:WD40 repeat domain-containing protein n=1 Tax=Acidicapsa dinghuensis TaxID=2218256 RepID=A0ABW1EM42_9BACT|nr:hypothetical protein [Acidicapsa dinghuensis]